MKPKEIVRTLMYKPLVKNIHRFRRLMYKSVNSQQLTKYLVDAGIGSGDIVMVHSSLSKIGNVKGGAKAVIESLISAVSESGTLLMPCYGSAEETYNLADQGIKVDLRDAKSTVGSITEEFRKWPGVYRSSHPFSSVCAWGTIAKYVTSGHEEEDSICHTTSPVGRLIELRGKILGIGVSIAYPSVYHAVENREDGFPFETYLPPRKICYIDATGREVVRMISRLDPRMASTRIDSRANGAWIRDKLTRYFLSKNIMKIYPFGETQCWVIDAASLYGELKFLASHGVTIYLSEQEWDNSLGRKLETEGILFDA